jgi:hypothetical protein
MTNRRAGIVAAILCAAGLFSAVALGVELQRPVVTPYSQSFTMADTLVPAEPATALTLPLESPLIQVAPMIIVGTSPVQGTARPEALAVPRDISEMHCTDWKALEQGSATQRVRLCS